jgi:hypothetical protein
MGRREAGSDEVGERERAALGVGALEQVVATGVDGPSERVPDDRQLHDPLLDLDQLVRRAFLETRRAA